MNAAAEDNSCEASPASKLFARIANQTSQIAGRASTFVLALTVVVAWAIAGPIFQYSDTWQLVINTGTTIITFLMVFLIQSSQNRDGAALQVKLDELIRASAAKNSFVGIEHLTEEELEKLRHLCEMHARIRRGDQIADEEIVIETEFEGRKGSAPTREEQT